jgi:hypothetical protein
MIHISNVAVSEIGQIKSRLKFRGEMLPQRKMRVPSHTSPTPYTTRAVVKLISGMAILLAVAVLRKLGTFAASLAFAPINSTGTLSDCNPSTSQNQEKRPD